jgi:SPP1 gp7 family putative phage head morphogenesis protein
MQANALLQDKAIDYAHDFHAYSQGVVQRMIAVLNRTDARLTAQLAEALMQMDAQTFTVERLEVLLVSVKALNVQAYNAVMAELPPNMRDLARVETVNNAAQLRAAVPGEIAVRFPIAGVSAEQVYATALSRPFQGRVLKDWAANLEQSRMTLIRNTVRAGFVEGQTTADIIKRVRGSKALNFRDGILQRGRSELAAVVQTALSHTAQTARQASYNANADLVKALAWVSTLDTKTSPMCRIRDGLKYTADTHKPIGHTVPWGGGPGALHFNCRSVSVPVLKSWKELGINVDEISPGTRASMDGQVAAEQTYAEWFAKQPAGRQDEILGPARAALYRSGKVSFGQMYSPNGRFLTLDELAKKVGA